MSMTPITDLPENPTVEDLKRFEGTLYVRNNSLNAVTCNVDGQPRFLLEPHGLPGDCKVMPRHALDQAGFHKMIRKGHLTVSPDFAAHALEGDRREIEAEERRDAELAAMTEENSSRKDLIQKSCLVCQEPLFQTGADIAALNPPLCQIHEDRAADYLGTPVQNEDGTPGAKFALLHNRS